MSAAITFDFHNTLVRCDRWFDLEVRTLPAVVGRTLFGPSNVPDVDALTEAYRALRTEIIAHGREMDAVSGVREAFRRVGKSVSPEQIRPVVDFVMSDAAEEAELMPGAKSTLDCLLSNNVPLGIVSSAVHHEFLDWALARLGVADAFLAITTSARSGYYKSRPEIYGFALEALGAVPERSVHVGDSYCFDHLAGQQAGLATVWLREPSALLPGDGREPDLELTSLEGAGPRLLRLLYSRKDGAHAD